MKLPRRQFLHLAAGAAALPTISRVAWAQAYPSRPVRIIASAAAGTAMDVHGRLHGQWLSERLGQPFIVENRPGAASTIGAAEAIRSRPDGYTLFLLPISLAVTANFYSKLPYNIVHDTSPIALLYQANYVMVVNPSFPAKSLPEFIAYAKANPGKINMGSQGVGSIGHLAGELFKSMTGIDMVHVAYRSVALALADMFSSQPRPIRFHRSGGGQVRALAVSSATRLAALPDVPTVAEYLPDYAFDSWLGIAGPKNIPAEIVEVLNREINASLARPAIKAKYDDLGLRIHPASPADFGKLVADDTEKWGKVIRAANIKLQ
jgi:tripartite-type tricarboxylate transporter receptor subunit TctC